MLEEISREIKGETVTIQIPKVEDWPISYLRRACKRNKAKGYTKMTKEQLVEAVKQILKELNRKKEKEK